MRRALLRNRHGQTEGVVILEDDEHTYTKFTVLPDKISKNPEDYYKSIPFFDTGTTVKYEENGEIIDLPLFMEYLPSTTGYF